MSNAAGTLELLAAEMASLFEPLAGMDPEEGGALLDSLGLRPPDSVAALAELGAAIASTTAAAADTASLLGALAAAIAAEDSAAATQSGVRLIERTLQIVEAARKVASVLDDQSANPALSPDERAALVAFAGVFVERLLGRLFVDYVETRFPQIAGPLLFTGVIEIEPISEGEPGSLVAYHTRKQFHLERLVRLVTDPLGLLRDVHRWGDPGFDGQALFRTLQTFLARQLNTPSEIIQAPGSPPILEAFAFNAEVVDDGVDVDIRVPGELELDETATVDDWKLTVATHVNFDSDLAISVRPPLELAVRAGSGPLQFSVTAQASRSKQAPPFLVLGSAQGSRLELQSPSAALGLEASVAAGAGSLSIEPELSLGLNGGKLVISGDGGDGFISQLLSGVNIESNFDVGLSWSPSRGIVFVGSAALEIAVPTHIALGPLEISTLYLRAGFKDDRIPIELSAAFSVALGPVKASVDRLGLVVSFSFPRGGGKLGPVDADFAFKPPNGVGLAIDAGVVKGGGYLYFDFENAEYAGALELTFAEFLSLKAIGLITTKLPDGKPGFSLLVIITAEFGTGIQLGFGFTLIGVGGLLGLNREMRLEPLVAGVRTGAVTRILFPRDVIANAPQIISDLKTFFPPCLNKFLIGPLAKLGWGSPALITLTLGIVIEIPGNIAILGVLRVALPRDDEALVVLQVSFVGAIEFDRKRVYFFATLFESRLLFMPLEGEMGVLAAFGADANFVLSVGGFHPRFDPPPLPFPVPKRVTLSILDESWARIQVETYLAVTTNTAQLGAHAELRFELEAVRVEGELGFDALLQFSPFYFSVEVSASVSLKVFGVGLFSIRLEFSLEGPTPWRARGTGHLELLFWEVSANFDHTWGESRDTSLPPLEVMPVLLSEFNKRDNWETQGPASKRLLVSLRKLEATAEDALVLHPVGTLRVSQKAVPLELGIDRVGAQKPADAERFRLEVVPGGLRDVGDASESFARAQFLDMSDASKLALPAFEPLAGGVLLSGESAKPKTSRAVARSVRYEEIIVDGAFRRVTRFFVGAGAFLFGLFSHLLRGSAVAKSPLSRQNALELKPFPDAVVAGPELYIVASQASNVAWTDQSSDTKLVFSSEAAARDHLERAVARDPSLARELHVIPEFEEAA
jgi:hypothetical protein